MKIKIDNLFVDCKIQVLKEQLVIKYDKEKIIKYENINSLIKEDNLTIINLKNNEKIELDINDELYNQIYLNFNNITYSKELNKEINEVSDELKKDNKISGVRIITLLFIFVLLILLYIIQLTNNILLYILISLLIVINAIVFIKTFHK